MIRHDRCFTAVLVSFIFRSAVVRPSFHRRSTVDIRRTRTGKGADSGGDGGGGDSDGDGGGLISAAKVVQKNGLCKFLLHFLIKMRGGTY